LHVSGVFGRGTALTELHRSREALLAFLASTLDAATRPHTTIVFDAAGAPPGLPQQFRYEGIDVQFARDPGNADELLEKLIAAHNSPRKLVVVSGDHRVQRAARRRRAKAIDSDRWWAELCAERGDKGPAQARPARKPVVDQSADDIAYWIRQFADSTQDATSGGQTTPPRDEFDNPFPPGYGDDLLDDA